jgi:putative PIN family toxin of toxin-antitoxin system
VRAVIDTNVLVSGLLWHGTPHRIIEHIRDGALTLISSSALLAEFADVISRPKFKTIGARSGARPERLLIEVRRLAEIVEPPATQPVSRDPDDDAVLALAVAARADLIVTGDIDLLILGSHGGIPIVDPAAAIVRINRSIAG